MNDLKDFLHKEMLKYDINNSIHTLFFNCLWRTIGSVFRTI